MVDGEQMQPFVDLLLFGIKIKNLHKYYITYRGEFSDLRGTQYYA